MITGQQTISGGMLCVAVEGQGYLWELSEDEAIVLDGYRKVRDHGSGSVYLEMNQRRITKWDVRPNVGSVEQLNRILAPKPLKD